MAQFFGSFQHQKRGDSEQERYLADGVPRYLHRLVDDTENTLIELRNDDDRKPWESQHEVGSHELMDLRKYTSAAGDGRSLRRTSVVGIVGGRLVWKH
ncbi:unnamed protein product [Linum trigynum]|uniref:Uncharacterized protein n=1 Tax=Linum trigynum TaxID=586398 RepID=A0AAV2EPH2_9ROSI